MRDWTPNPPQLIPADGQSGVAIEIYSEERNGFYSGQRVQTFFADGDVAVIEIVEDTQTVTLERLDAVLTEPVETTGYRNLGELRAALTHCESDFDTAIQPPRPIGPSSEGENPVVSVVRYKVVEVLAPAA